MKIQANSPEEYLKALPEDRKTVVSELRNIIKANLPKGFQEEMNYGMIGFVVPHSIYPQGYHCDPKLPLPFMNIASQKNFVAIYHMGIYADEKLLTWFQEEYARFTKAKLDMSKSCIRFKKPEHIPYKLIGELASKISVEEWIQIYEKNILK